MDNMKSENKRGGENFTPEEYMLIRRLVQTRLEQKHELEFESFDGYELPPRTQFSMLNKPAVTIKRSQMTFNMACIRLFEGVKYILPIINVDKERLAVVMCTEEESASVEWARKRKKDDAWVNKPITSNEFIRNIYKLMNWNRECRYKILGRLANSSSGLILVFDLGDSIMFTPNKLEYVDPITGEMKKKEVKYFPDEYENHIGKSFSDYVAIRQLNLFEDFIGYQGEVSADMTFNPKDDISSAGSSDSVKETRTDE